jgi:hypothetical protein
MRALRERRRGIAGAASSEGWRGNSLLLDTDVTQACGLVGRCAVGLMPRCDVLRSGGHFPVIKPRGGHWPLVRIM